MTKPSRARFFNSMIIGASIFAIYIKLFTLRVEREDPTVLLAVMKAPYFSISNTAEYSPELRSRILKIITADEGSFTGENYYVFFVSIGWLIPILLGISKSIYALASMYVLRGKNKMVSD